MTTTRIKNREKRLETHWLPSVPPAGAHGEGYTLIELVVVMALVSIMFFFAMPRFRDNMLSDPMGRTSRWLINQTRHLKQQSMREKKDYILHVDMEANKLWVSTADMQAEAREKAEDGAFQLAEEVDIMDVEFPVRGRISSGQVEILYYARGYSDKALIHLQHENDRQVSFLIEPFLPQIKYIEDYSEFGD
jgi:prepilin-type N-terminal cleavage/methylation domain-containing protein